MTKRRGIIKGVVVATLLALSGGAGAAVANARYDPRVRPFHIAPGPYLGPPPDDTAPPQGYLAGDFYLDSYVVLYLCVGPVVNMHDTKPHFMWVQVSPNYTKPLS